jgi:putative ABC transport system permease protein
MQDRHSWLRRQADILWHDVRGAVRLLRRNRVYAATAILTLALGIGGSTSIFSVVHAVVLRPLAFPESKRVVRVGWASAEWPDRLFPATHTALQTIREKTAAFDLIGGTHHDSLSSEGRPLHVPTGNGGMIPPLMVSASLFRLLGASTVLGRLPDERDEAPGATPVAVLTHRTWTSFYGRDPEVVGRTLARWVGGGRQKPVTIVGVLAPDAIPYPLSQQATVWSSFDTEMTRARGDGWPESSLVSIYARLAPGVSLEAARAELAALSPHLEAGLSAGYAERKASLSATSLRDETVGRVRAPLLAFLWAVLCLLIVASVNVASLVLARAMSRRQEFAARLALGAQPIRIARQLLTESLVLAIAGGTLGLALALAGRRAFVAISPPLPRLDQSGLDTASLLFALGGVLLAACVAGVLPAVQTARRGAAGELRQSGGAAGAATGFSRPLSMLAAVEVAMVLVLLAGTGLLVNSFARLVRFDLGVDARSLITFHLTHVDQPQAASAPARRTDALQSVAVLSETQRRRMAVEDEVVRRVSALPGVASAGLMGARPLSGGGASSLVERAGSIERVYAIARFATAAALDAAGMRLVAGRWFTDADRDGTPLAAVVNETMARRLWEGRSPIGERIIDGRRVLEVIGIVADVHEGGARREAQPAFYMTTAQVRTWATILIVRERPGAAGVGELAAAELAQMSGRLQAGWPQRLEDVWWQQLTDARFLTQVLVIFSVLALAVALVGVHGVLRFSVEQRMREMGIRKALGATPFDLVALVMGHALRFALAGCIAGLAAALAAGPAIRSLLFGIAPTDPATLAAATALLIVAVIVAAYLPARRANAVDPAISLRCE